MAPPTPCGTAYKPKGVKCIQDGPAAAPNGVAAEPGGFPCLMDESHGKPATSYALAGAALLPLMHYNGLYQNKWILYMW